MKYSFIENPNDYVLGVLECEISDTSIIDDFREVVFNSVAFKEKLNNNGIFVYFDIKNENKFSSDVAAILSSTYIKDNKIYISFDVLNGPSGFDLKNVALSNVGLTFSVAALSLKDGPYHLSHFIIKREDCSDVDICVAQNTINQMKILINTLERSLALVG